MGTGILGRKGLRRFAFRSASGAEGKAQLAMHMDHVTAAGALVKVVDILGDERDGARIVGFEPCERPVGGIWSNRCKAARRPL